MSLPIIFSLIAACLAIIYGGILIQIVLKKILSVSIKPLL